MAELKTPAAEQALAEHLAAVRPPGQRPWATAYHETVDDFRRELASESAMFHKRMKPHLEVTHELYETKRAGRPAREPTAAENDAYTGCLMAGNYAYTLAAVLQLAGEAFGQEVAERLACVADDILINGDDHDRNADVMPPEDGAAHKCGFPVQPPAGSWLNPGPCEVCGKTWDRAQAERALAEAQAAMAATEPAADDDRDEKARARLTGNTGGDPYADPEAVLEDGHA